MKATKFTFLLLCYYGQYLSGQNCGYFGKRNVVSVLSNMETTFYTGVIDNFHFGLSVERTLTRSLSIYLEGAMQQKDLKSNGEYSHPINPALVQGRPLNHLIFSAHMKSQSVEAGFKKYTRGTGSVAPIGSYWSVGYKKLFCELSKAQGTANVYESNGPKDVDLKNDPNLSINATYVNLSYGATHILFRTLLLDISGGFNMGISNSMSIHHDPYYLWYENETMNTANDWVKGEAGIYNAASRYFLFKIKLGYMF